jgi:hypothetical protein
MSVSTRHAVVSATRLAGCAAFLLGIGAAGCSSFDAGSDTCENYPSLSSTCDPVGMAGNPLNPAPPDLRDMPEEWQCLVTEDVVTPAMPGRVTYIFPVVDFDTDPRQAPLPVPGVQLTVCTNAACTPPAGPPEVIIGQPDPMRPYIWAIEIPYGIGAFSIRAEATGYVDTDYYVGGPMVGTLEGSNRVVALALPMPKIATLDNLLSNNLALPTLAANPSVGILAVRTLNCNRPAAQGFQGVNQGSRGAGVRVELVSSDPVEGAVPWVLSVGNQATRDIAETDGRGVAGFANLTPRTYTVRGIAPAPRGSETGTPIGAKPAVATVRASAVTLVEVREGIDVWGQ